MIAMRIAFLMASTFFLQEVAMAGEERKVVDTCDVINNQYKYDNKVISIRGYVSADPHYNMIIRGDQCEGSIAISATRSLKNSAKFKSLRDDVFREFPYGKNVAIRASGEFRFYPKKVPSRIFIMQDLLVSLKGYEKPVPTKSERPGS